MKEFTIISRTISEREITVRASSAAEALQLARDNVEAPDGYIAFSNTIQPGLISTGARIEILQTFTRDEADAVRDVLAERERQTAIEGWTPEHDDEHDAGELAGAGAAYALNAACLLHPQAGDAIEDPPECWPFEKAWWRPNMGDNPRRDLIKAAAMILAEISRLGRSEGARND